MITRLTHTFIYVLDLERAVDFYTKKLGFIPHTDILVLGERWVTVTPPLQTELQILLVPAQQSMIFETQQALWMQQLI
jgi:catechol 2,3-dioxygenase-like lactoylglutathione lyase family enzyme